MRDPYLSQHRAIARLLEEYERYGRLIIAFDFDDTVFDTHENNWTYCNVSALLREIKKLDCAYIICWTASLPERYPFIRDYLNEHNIPFDAINENAPGIEDKGKKIYANIYLDDRAGLPAAYEALGYVINIIKEDRRYGI